MGTDRDGFNLLSVTRRVIAAAEAKMGSCILCPPEIWRQCAWAAAVMMMPVALDAAVGNLIAMQDSATECPLLLGYFFLLMDKSNAV